jgi:hypothetical protein
VQPPETISFYRLYIKGEGAVKMISLPACGSSALLGLNRFLSSVYGQLGHLIIPLKVFPGGTDKRYEKYTQNAPRYAQVAPKYTNPMNIHGQILLSQRGLIGTAAVKTISPPRLADASAMLCLELFPVVTAAASQNNLFRQPDTPASPRFGRPILLAGTDGGIGSGPLVFPVVPGLPNWFGW